MQISRIRSQLKLFRNVSELPVFARSYHVGFLAEFLGLFDGLGGPCSGIDVIAGAAVCEQIERNHCELECGAALKEQYGIIVGYGI